MFARVQEGTPTMGTPSVEEMARNKGPIPQADALAYCRGLPEEKRGVVNGCYVVHCVRGCKCPVACIYNQTCGECLWPGCGTIPFGCCIILNRMGTAHYVNAKGDTLVMKVDEPNETLACYANGSGGPCCYCMKQ
jgi:hypothetical protein